MNDRPPDDGRFCLCRMLSAGGGPAAADVFLIRHSEVCGLKESLLAVLFSVT